MTVITGNEFGLALCGVFGIDPKHIGNITLNARAGEIATVTIERAVTEEETGKLLKVLSAYALLDQSGPAQQGSLDLPHTNPDRHNEN